MEEVKIEEKGAFIFLTPENGKEMIRVRQRGKDFKARLITEPTIFSRYQTEVEGRGPLIESPKLDLAAVVTDKKMYLAKKTKHLFLAMLNRPDQEVRIEIKHNGQFLLETERKLNEVGLLHEPLELQDLGEYEIQAGLKEDPEVTVHCSFEVAEYTMSPLTAVLRSHTLDGQVLSFEVGPTPLGENYEGEARIDLRCGYCSNMVWATPQLTATLFLIFWL
jgi:hypothetical protein